MPLEEIINRLKQQPYSSNPPADDGEFTGGISLEELKEKYSSQSEELWFSISGRPENTALYSLVFSLNPCPHTEKVLYN